MDASGCEKDIPTEKLDILIAGTSCVDFSTLNNKKDQRTQVNAFLEYGFSLNDLTGDGEAIPLGVGVTQEFRDAVNKQLSPEGLESIGESMTTFLSTLNFIMERRPRIVILENVQTAPWKAMQRFWLASAGYAAEYVRVDSKDFHVPQDRIRGYLVALDAREFNDPESDATPAALVHQACEYVYRLKQRASASVLRFLMDEEDPNYLQARDEITRHGSQGLTKGGKRGNNEKAVDWDFCRLRHAIYSQRWNLDNTRRFSQATLSHGRVVSIATPARSWIDYWKHETPRVIDLMDKLYQLFLVTTSCDLNFKVLMHNISQNVDRLPIGIRKFGIAPIITPTGMPTLSNLGRPLLGGECLTLQGIPRHRLQLAGESHRELRDLAGNAMTVTVVGAVILATLSAAGKPLSAIQLRSGRKALPKSTSSYVDVMDRGLKELTDWDLGDFSLDVPSLLAYGKFKVCHCPPVGSHTRITYCCRSCGKVACDQCKNNPAHDFERHDDASHLTNFADLKVHIQQGMPGVFTMAMEPAAQGFSFAANARGASRAMRTGHKASLKHNVFFFSGIKMSTASVIVEYRSQHNRAMLTLSKVGVPEWSIFATRSVDLDTSPIGARDRNEKAIARGILHPLQSTVDPAAARWFSWQHVKHSWRVAVSVKTDDSFTLDHTTMEPRLAPPDYLESHVRDSIRGVWHASPQCGTAGDGLYIREPVPGGEKLFCFKDVDPVGHPANDYYIITRDVELAETYEYRGDEVTIEKIQMENLGETVTVSVPGYWMPILAMPSFSTKVHASDEEDDSFHLASCATITGPGPEPESCCDTPPLTLLKFRIFLPDLPFPAASMLRWSERWHNVQASEMEEFSRCILFATNALEKGYLFRPGSGLSFDPLRGVPVEFCADCCIEPPQLHWVKGSNQIVPWEDPASVQEYERKVKAMPKPFMARVSLDSDSYHHLMEHPSQPQSDMDKGTRASELGFHRDNRSEFDNALRVQMAVHPRTMASRAAAHLVYGCRPRNFSRAILDGVECSFQAEAGGLVGPNIRFDRFYDCIPTTEDVTGLSKDAYVNSINPRSFLIRGHELFEEQERSVRWMLARETAPAPYPETESEEQVFGDSTLRIIARAVYPNDGSALCCRGGILAHEIGYGKTVVMIALLEHQRSFDQTQSIAKRQEAAEAFWESELSFIHLKATLVIVPEHITKQWEAEVAKFGSATGVVVIQRYAELRKMSLRKLEAADVIIVAASIFDAGAYTSGIGSLMEARPTGGKSDREVQDRYRTSLETVRKVVRRYRELPSGLDAGDKNDRAVERAEEVVDELTANYQALCQQYSGMGGRKEANRRQQQGKKRAAAAAAADEVEVGVERKQVKKSGRRRPVWTVTSFLENFSFARIVLDEFSYQNSGATLFLTNSLANAKWLLSGTPRCDNLADIVEQGRLLSVHVARPDPCIPTYLDPITVGPVKKPTAPSEEYRDRASHLRSHHYALDRHHAAETFVKHFMRQDKVNMANIERETRKIELELPLLSRLAYGGMRHDLAKAKNNTSNLPVHLLSFLSRWGYHPYPGDDVGKDPKAADVMMALFAAVPMEAHILKVFLGSADRELQYMKTGIKLSIDKLLWLCQRFHMINPEVLDKYRRHYQIRTQITDIFTAMSDARGSDNAWPMAAFGGRDAFVHFTKTICPITAFKYQKGGLESWRQWRYNDAKSFWPDWYDLPDDYIDGLAAPERRQELEDLALEAILLSISMKPGRKIALDGGLDWLRLHAVTMAQAMVDRFKHDFLEARQTPATERARAEAVRKTVPKFTTPQLIDFLKECMKEKRDMFKVDADDKAEILTMSKDDLHDYCMGRDLKFAHSNTVADLVEKIQQYDQGYMHKKADFIHERGCMPHRVEIPTPNQILDRRGGKTEAMLEELTVTYNFLMTLREHWFTVFRRYRLYDFMRFATYSQGFKWVEKYCDGCIVRNMICRGDKPGFIVLGCGHWLCEDHKQLMNQGGAKAWCPALGCGAHMGLTQPDTTLRVTEQDVLTCPNIWEPEGEAVCAQGGKMPLIVSLVKDTPEEDKVVVFTYIEELAVSVRDKLAEDGVSVLSMVANPEGENLSSILEDFKQGKAKVLIVDPTAEHAAGSNLTIANHIIFASPLLDRDSFLRKMHYRQAAGRCLRQGQKKKVILYTLVSKGTIDEELYDEDAFEDVGDEPAADA